MATKATKEQYLQTLPIADKVSRGRSLTLDDLLTEEGLLLVECLVRDGMTLQDVARTLGITNQTFFTWRQKYPQLEEACKKGKDLVDYKVENALLKAALGYTKTKSTVYIGATKANRNREVGGETVTEEVGPSVTACLAWLNNRKPEQWRRNRDNFMELEDKPSGITINIIKGKNGEESNDSGE